MTRFAKKIIDPFCSLTFSAWGILWARKRRARLPPGGIPKFPAVTRDIAIVLDAEVPAGHVEKLIRQRGGKALEKCTLFDCYIGSQVPEGKKSLAYALAFRDATKTLTDEDVSKFMKKILNGLEMQFGASLR